ncbi:MAG: UDP-N-acetylmuramate--L-alanine ligase [Defluviitaleaceae bacterium]|nr:UDP-N-acetylmuramate--L-alanine ligase [Defluviitaleaceae bacterium]MCL2262472.1 UDP-N-acetylmuramate--L-alanine ligase [Defluviitaleaceae bacterium]
MREKIELNGAKNIHFIGIGGISMSGLAEILHRDGFGVSGSDDVASEITKRLSELGITVSIPNAAGNVSPKTDLAVYTAAVKPDNAEFRAAHEMGIPLIERAAFIGKILHGYDPVCVAGSHGKTTTTSMVSEVAIAAGLDPTISIGGHMNRGGMNYRIGNSTCFVLEACEYSNSFHHWHPQTGIILNVDADHLDFFGSFENLIESFAKFASNIRESGTLVIQAGIVGFEKITANLQCEIITFGLEKSGARFWARDIAYNAEKPSFDVMDGRNFLARVNLPLPGEYNMLNALACFAAAASMGIAPQVTAEALNAVQGTKRRFEFKREFNGAKIIDDYAHHPTEVQNCLAAARKSTQHGKIVCVFQPHTYTRTKNLLHEFAEAFHDADKIILLPIYAAREPFDPAISSEILAEEMKKRGKDVIFAENFSKASNCLCEMLQAGDMALTMGAGDVYEVSSLLP